MYLVSCVILTGEVDSQKQRTELDTTHLHALITTASHQGAVPFDVDLERTSWSAKTVGSVICQNSSMDAEGGSGLLFWVLLCASLFSLFILPSLGVERFLCGLGVISAAEALGSLSDMAIESQNATASEDDTYVDVNIVVEKGTAFPYLNAAWK